MFASKKRVKDVTEDELPIKSQTNTQGSDPNAAVAAATANVNKANLELAKRLASRINQSLESGRQTNVVQQATQALMKGGSIGQNPISVSQCSCCQGIVVVLLLFEKLKNVKK
ncbi:putative ATP-dependent RNA helicase DDX46 [Holothuria leucospilota]|uniref:ATP-dependent RNA helicase DDX46 n=1 Tax=Holothuria leucospilota TaxID=206669 RepID=A0A9Q1HA85_HOLLE|nr:putative ATP-dependent RNA helicase DDX46 [Holothuria leucospilota]